MNGAAAPVPAEEKEGSRIKATVVITAYQAEETIGRAVRSVLDTPRRKEIEVIVVDDASTDGTAAVVQELCRRYPNLRLITMPVNSGSPSLPRNRGIAEARGVYVSTLDDDDYYDADSYFQLLDTAFREELDFVKGYLIVHEGGRTYAANRLEQAVRPGRDAIEKIVASQSLTADYLVKRDILTGFGLGYDPALKIGEDTALITDILSHCERVTYVDLAYLHYVKVPAAADNLSSTQRWATGRWRCAGN